MKEQNLGIAELIGEIAKKICEDSNNFDPKQLENLSIPQKCAARNLLTMISSWSSILLSSLPNDLSYVVLLSELKGEPYGSENCNGQLRIESCPTPVDREIQVLLSNSPSPYWLGNDPESSCECSWKPSKTASDTHASK